jgi:hypothetical protein
MITVLSALLASAQQPVAPPIETPLPEVTIASNIPAVEWSCVLDPAKGKSGRISGVFGPILRSPSYNVALKVDRDETSMFGGRIEYVQERYGTYTVMIWPSDGSLGRFAAFHFGDLSGVGDVEFSTGAKLTDVIAAGRCSVSKVAVPERGA